MTDTAAPSSRASLTKNEKAVLAAMSLDWPGSSPEELARAVETSALGACQIASSLVRKGLASREYRLGLVNYWRTGN